jgi:cytochrome c oxidase assembly protein subunit 15
LGRRGARPYHREVRVPRISAAQFRRITLVVVLAVSAIVVTGAAVRLTGSGLGCTDWPACTHNHLVAKAELHPQIEFINREFTGVISIAVALAVLGSLFRDPRRRDLIWWSLGLVGGLVAEILLGGLLVLSDLWPPFVMAHFLLGATLVWNAVVLHHRAGHAGTPGVLTVAPRVRTLARVLAGAAGAVLLTGTIVTGSGPHGGDEHVRRLPFFVEDVARIHSATVWVFLALTIATLVTLARFGGGSRLVQRRGRQLVALIIAQGALGYTQYFTGVPPTLVLLHVIGAVAVWIVTLGFYLSLFAHPELGPSSAERSESIEAAAVPRQPTTRMAT